MHVLHAIDGRLRIKVSSVKNNAARADAFCTALRGVRGVRCVVPNVVTGSITITYDDTKVDSVAICLALGRIAGERPVQLPDRPTPLVPSSFARLSSNVITTAGITAIQVVVKTAIEAVLTRAIYSLI
jgi:hypothetical protein